MNNEGNISESDQIRRRCVIDYVKIHPECDKEDVITHCTAIGEGSRVTLSQSIKDLIKDGVLSDGKVRKNSKSYKLTVVSENLSLIIPQDLEDIFSRLKTFTSIIKKKVENGITLSDESAMSRITNKFEYESKQSLPFLPYYVTEIINSLYTFYFNFMLPKKIENKSIINRLYLAYLERLSKIYSFILKELGDIIIHTDYVPAKIKSTMYKGHFESEQPELFPIYRTARMCRINGIEEELYNVLDQLWIRNDNTCLLLYAINSESKPLEKKSISGRKMDKMSETKDGYEVQNNRTLDKIHLYIDNFVYQQEKDEEQEEKEQFEGENTYNSFD
ncbi:MAG: hypothetical protein L0H55_14550 [Candidatus Nitrosocosmicus sp.]|nr:hypothetical protein [Candidatus Nitrosocosmicus sp.]